MNAFKILKVVGLAMGCIGGVIASAAEAPEVIEAFNEAKKSNSESKEGEA